MIRDLRVYLESMGGANRIAYYRDEKGLEVDVIPVSYTHLTLPTILRV